MGALSRRKGHDFERWLATQLRTAFPTATVRRSDQGYGAYESDVVVEGEAPELVKRIWWECQCSRSPTPKAKLEQAERDTLNLEGRIPVVVWREHGSRSSFASLRYVSLLHIEGGEQRIGNRIRGADMLVTLPFQTFLGLLRGAGGTDQ